MCLLNNFCCCCSLRTGAIITAVLSFIGDLLSFGVAVYFLVGAKVIEDDLWRYDTHQRREYQQAISIARVFAYVLVAIGALGLLIATFLSIAIAQNRAGFVIPWLTWCAVSLLAMVGLSIYNLVLGQWIILMFIPGILYGIYNWVVILSFYYELKK